MKKVIFAILGCVACLTNVKGQMTKGNLFMGTTLGAATYNNGNYSYDYSDGNVQKQDDKKYAVTLAPQIGVFVTDHLVFGGSLGFGYNHEDNFITNTTDGALSHDRTTNNTTFYLGPFFRYYFFDAAPKKAVFYVQAQASAGTGGGNTSDNYTTTTGSTAATGTINNEFVFMAGGGIGMTYLIDKNIGLDLGVDYLYNYDKYTNNSTTVTTTGGIAGAGSAGDFKATEPNSGIGISAGFHLMFK
jgi:hypothetical protein